MTEPKRSSSSQEGKAPPQAADEDNGGVAAGLGALREALASRASDSLNVVMLTRDRIQDAFDDAVARGHMTRETANNLAQELISRSRREWQDVFSDIEQLLGRSRLTAPAQAALQQVGRAVGGDAFPIAGYDDLTAAQITDRLDGLTPAELRRVRDYERRHGNRKSVLAAVERKLR